MRASVLITIAAVIHIVGLGVINQGLKGIAVDGVPFIIAHGCAWMWYGFGAVIGPREARQVQMDQLVIRSGGTLQVRPSAQDEE